METVEFELGSYTGDLQGGVPHGVGQMVYRQDDPLQREIYDGAWQDGSHSGTGTIKFRSGEIYSGEFQDNLPHGAGEFIYPNGDKEEVRMEGGVILTTKEVFIKNKNLRQALAILKLTLDTLKLSLTTLRPPLATLMPPWTT